MTMTTRQFKISVWYFKPSGKFYTEAEFTGEFGLVGDDGCYMNDVVEHIRQIRAADLAAPGLQGSGRHFYALVSCEHGYPVLIPPESE